MQSPFLIHAGLAFLNLVGLGTGYLVLKDWKRWIPAFVISAGLLLAGLMTDSLIYLLVLSVWLLLLAVDGFLQARKRTFDKGRLSQWPWLPIPIGLLFIGLYYLSASVYLNAAQAAYERGMARYITADCAGAAEHFSQVTGIYRLADAGNNRRADEKSQECRFYNSGDDALETGDYQSAIDSFDVYLSSYPGSPLTQQTIDKGAEAYLLWADELRTTSDYQGALEKYTELAVKYPNATQILDVPAEITETNVEWGDHYHQNEEYEEAIKQYQLVQLGPAELAADYSLESRIASVHFDWAASQRAASEFESAIEHFQVVLDQYSDTTAAELAAEAIPPSYYEWAQMLIADGQVQEGIDLYDLLLERYPDTESAEQAEAGRAAAYLSLAKNLFEQGEFNDAIEMYHFIQEITEDEDLLSQVEAGLEVTITGLSMDRGEEGREIMEESLKLACDNRPAEFPGINSLPDERGKFLACENSPNALFISDELRARFPAELRYAVMVTLKAHDLNRQRYGLRGTLLLYRQRLDWEVSVIDVSSGKIVATNTFNGGPPPDFPPIWYFDSNPDYLQGDPPSMIEVEAWLNTIF